MYLWFLVISEKDVSFKFTEHTKEKEEKFYTGFFTTDQSYPPDAPEIKPIVEAAFKLAKELNLSLSDQQQEQVSIKREFQRLVVIHNCGVFEAKLKNDEIALGTENDRTFTRQQFNAMFDFLDVLKETNWFF